MASPSSPGAEDTSREKQGDITFRFCRECSNMLYPKEDLDSRTLQFACRTCQYSETAEGTCVYRNYLSNTAGETAGVTQDVGFDPTLPRSNKACPMCKNEDAVFFQSQQRHADTGMKLFYVCCSCGHIFN